MSHGRTARARTACVSPHAASELLGGRARRRCAGMSVQVAAAIAVLGSTAALLGGRRRVSVCLIRQPAVPMSWMEKRAGV